jgi:hypothetical protein
LRQSQRLFFFLSLWIACSGFVPGSASGATYLPLSDEELARRSPAIVRARVVGQETRIVSRDGEDAVLTVTRFQPLEIFKGTFPSDVFEVALPGGVLGDVASWVPGTPAFAARGEVILFLAPPADGSETFRLTEFGLSKFDVVPDRAARLFAVRSVFRPEEDDDLSLREGSAAAGAFPRALREAESFAAGLRAAGAGKAFPPISYSVPDPEARGPDGVTPAWVNLGGQEGAANLYRWFWDTGRSAAARVSAVGTQSGLSDGSDGIASVQNAVAQWAGVAGANVLYSQSSGSAPVVVHLDVDSESSYWSGPLPCTSGGIIGLGGPGKAVSAGSFRGDGRFYAITSANVWMRRITGGCYAWETFRTAVLHELGHTLGLGHSDQATSVHSSTPENEWLTAVMVSNIPPSLPSTPQPDDIEAVLWLYGAGGSSMAPSAGFTVSSESVLMGQAAQFTDTSTGSPSTWSWSFGDGGSSTQRSPAHAYASAGVYTVTLTVANSSGSNSRSQTVTAVPATPPRNGRQPAEIPWRRLLRTGA